MNFQPNPLKRKASGDAEQGPAKEQKTDEQEFDAESFARGFGSMDAEDDLKQPHDQIIPPEDNPELVGDFNFNSTEGEQEEEEDKESQVTNIKLNNVHIEDFCMLPVGPLEKDPTEAQMDIISAVCKNPNKNFLILGGDICGKTATALSCCRLLRDKHGRKVIYMSASQCVAAMMRSPTVASLLELPSSYAYSDEVPMGALQQSHLGDQKLHHQLREVVGQADTLIIDDLQYLTGPMFSIFEDLMRKMAQLRNASMVFPKTFGGCQVIGLANFLGRGVPGKLAVYNDIRWVHMQWQIMSLGEPIMRPIFGGVPKPPDEIEVFFNHLGELRLRGGQYGQLDTFLAFLLGRAQEARQSPIRGLTVCTSPDKVNRHNLDNLKRLDCSQGKIFAADEEQRSPEGTDPVFIDMLKMLALGDAPQEDKEGRPRGGLLPTGMCLEQIVVPEMPVIYVGAGIVVDQSVLPEDQEADMEAIKFGQFGHVVGFSVKSGFPIVKFYEFDPLAPINAKPVRSCRVVVAKERHVISHDMSNTSFMISQVPLIPGYAVSVDQVTVLGKRLPSLCISPDEFQDCLPGDIVSVLAHSPPLRVFFSGPVAKELFNMPESLIRFPGLCV